MITEANSPKICRQWDLAGRTAQAELELQPPDKLTGRILLPLRTFIFDSQKHSRTRSNPSRTQLTEAERENFTSTQTTPLLTPVLLLAASRWSMPPSDQVPVSSHQHHRIPRDSGMAQLVSCFCECLQSRVELVTLVKKSNSAACFLTGTCLLCGTARGIWRLERLLNS